MKKATAHWPSILILIVIVLGAGLFLLVAMGMGIGSIITLATNGEDSISSMIIALSALMEGLILLACAWFVLEKALGREQADNPIKGFPFAAWQIIVAFAVVGFALGIGNSVSKSAIQGLLIFEK